MTIEEKFEEAQFFLTKLKEPLTAIEIRHYYSAYLTAVSIIFDHLLEDANQKFYLGIPLNEFLDSKKFRMIAQYSGNIRAKRFIDWYDDVYKEIRKTNSGKIFHVERNRSIHRRIETPQLIAKMQTSPMLNGDFISTMQFVPNLSKKEAKQYYEENADNYFVEINKRREATNQPKCDSIVTSFHFTLGKNHEVNLAEACEEFLQTVEDYILNQYNGEFYLRRI